jgi:acetyltransferase-like isoleucine patch superfamily enzyme
MIWRECNKHNFTIAGNVFPLNKVSVGNYTYGTLNVHHFDNDDEQLIIGSFCSIAGDVVFLLGGEHKYSRISTFPIKKYVLNAKENTITKGPIRVGNDVWIGQDCIILSGVTIGQGAIIGAGSVVSKDIPPYAIFFNNSVKKFRFDKNIIDKLISVDYSILSNENIHQFVELFEAEIDVNYFESTAWIKFKQFQADFEIQKNNL